MKDVMNEALARRKDKAMKIEIIINGKPQEDEQESGLAPEVKDKGEQEEKLVAQDANEMPEDEEHEDEDQDMQMLKAMMGEATDRQGRASVGLEERARELMRAKLEEKKKAKA